VLRPSRPAALLAVVSALAGVLGAPGTARAAPAPDVLSRAEMAAALAPVVAATRAAEAGGWKAALGFSYGGFTGAGSFVADPVAGRTADTSAFGEGSSRGSYFAAGKGSYRTLNNDEVDEAAAVRMTGRTGVRYVFTADTRTTFADHMSVSGPSGSHLAAEQSKYAGTRTVDADGTVEFTAVDADGITFELEVSAAGVVTSAAGTANGATTSFGYSYGPQTVTLPAAAQTVPAKTLASAVAYMDLAKDVKQVAVEGARYVQRQAAGKRVSVATLRLIIKRDAAALNDVNGAVTVRVKHIAGGVKVHGTNPWTKQTVAFTVTASGRKAVVKKG
jgi:hypothetical protein